MAAGVGDDALQHIAVAQVKVPIIRPANNEVLHCQRSPNSEQDGGKPLTLFLIKLSCSRPIRARSFAAGRCGRRAVTHVVKPRLDITNAPGNTIRNPTIVQKSASTRSAAR
ncbi:hypothetical protein D3C72_1937310 [compost metagenome]